MSQDVKPIVVQKYGGSSVADPQRLGRVADRVAATVALGKRVVVVVSAMGKTTDELLALARTVTETPPRRELDMLLSCGERISMALLAMALEARGLSAISFTGSQSGILTNDRHSGARIIEVRPVRLEDELARDKVVIVAGFQGMNEKGEATTLGRGGSDLTAIALAAALQADKCEIYTDVDGVYTTDPHVVPGARRLKKISYEEMLEMASLGAKVLQARSVEFAAKYQVPVRVLSSFSDGEGTLVTKEDRDMERVVVSGVTYDKNQAKITITGVPDQPGIAARLFGVIAEAGVIVDMILQNVSQEGLTDISFTLPKGDARKAVEIARKIAREIGARDVQMKEEIAKVSIVGVGMRTHSGVAAQMFAALSKEGINIMMISTSEIKISCVIDAKYTELAVRALHDAFELGKG